MEIMAENIQKRHKNKLKINKLLFKFELITTK